MPQVPFTYFFQKAEAFGQLAFAKFGVGAGFIVVPASTLQVICLGCGGGGGGQGGTAVNIGGNGGSPGGFNVMVFVPPFPDPFPYIVGAGGVHGLAGGNKGGNGGATFVNGTQLAGGGGGGSQGIGPGAGLWLQDASVQNAGQGGQGGTAFFGLRDRGNFKARAGLTPVGVVGQKGVNPGDGGWGGGGVSDGGDGADGLLLVAFCSRVYVN